MIRRPTIALALCLALTGCVHKRPAPPALPQASAPVVLEPAPTKAQVEIPAPPPEPTPIPPADKPKPRRPRKPKPIVPPPTAAPAPVEVATNTPTPAEANPIGQLSTGGDTSDRAKSDTRNLIAQTQKNLAALSSETARQHATAINQIKTFLRQADEALNSNDLDGARNLANKAKLLLDDIKK